MRAHRAGGRRAWALPGAVAATTAWSASVADGFPAFLPWLAPVAGLLGLTAVVVLVSARPGRRTASGGRLALVGLTASLVAGSSRRRHGRLRCSAPRTGTPGWAPSARPARTTATVR
ncbi:hypothetical protein ACFZA1_23760 [Streptomyces filipinensis]|uniref:hypothetical protein n=1 Tax=Streptomyces filipinensis TaxID=66887 RepID=UPI0036F0D8F3